MGLFGRSRSKHDKPDAVETESEDLDGDDPELDGPATWYRAMYQEVVHAGEDVLLHDAERAAPIVIPHFELSLLEQCTNFSSIEAHASTIARHTGLPADGVAQQLYDLVDRGLLTSQKEVLDQARTFVDVDADARPAPAIDRIAVITGDRPSSLASCLRSYRRRYGDDLELIVFDDSADPAMRAENRSVALKAAAGRILYAGPDEKHRLVADLARRSGVDPEIVRAAVVEFDGCSWHSGANRNAALLDASGGAVVMVDDDTTARATYGDAGDAGFRLSSRADPWSLRFFANVQDAINEADWDDLDLLAWHRRFLGRSPAACAFATPTGSMSLPPGQERVDPDLNDADSGLIAAFCRGHGRVVVTSAGIAGDSGMGPQVSFLSLRGSARERFLEDYDAHRATRAVHRGADAATIANTRFLMTPHVAFDVTGAIPPFSPVLRNEDAVFANLLRTCAPRAYVAFLPFSVEHVPVPARTMDFEEVLRSITRVPSNSIIRDLSRAHEPGFGVTDPVRRLRAFGQYLVGLGTMPPDDFDALVRYQIAVAIGRRIERLARSVEVESGTPELWAEDCARAMTLGFRALADEALVASDIPGVTPNERQRGFQRLLYRFGRVIDAWPALLDAARDIRVAEPLQS